MAKQVKNGKELTEVLERNQHRGKLIKNGDGRREFHINESQGRIYYEEDKEFSPGMRAFINGVLAVFGIALVALMFYFG